MSLFGSLSSAVSGIQAQGTAIGIISDNISNVNTVGYKAGSQVFSTLVTDSGAIGFSPGGVRAQNRQLIDQQGLIQTTNSPLDIAISGQGFFVVADDAGGLADDATIGYTRAGSFRTDSLGNFVNASGQFLQAYPVDGEGRLPGEPGNTTNTTLSTLLESLETVNIGAASGAASATSLVEVGLNLDAEQSVFRGASDTATPGSDPLNVENRAARSDDLLVPNSNLSIGDTITAAVNGGNSYDFTYGGFAQSNDVLAGSILGANSLTDQFSSSDVADGDTFTITRSGDSANPITFTYTTTSSPNVSAGFFNSLATLSAAIDNTDGLTGRVETVGGESRLYLAAENANEGLELEAGIGSRADFPAVLGLTDPFADFVQSNEISVAAPILGATTRTGAFTGAADGDAFTIERSGDAGNPITFTYSTTVPLTAGQFNNLDSLQEAIQAETGFQADIQTIDGETRLFVAGNNTLETITVAPVGTPTGDFAAALNFGATPGATGTDPVEAVQTAIEAGVSNRYNTLEGLADLVNNETIGDLGAEIQNGNTATASIEIFNSDPLTALTFSSNDDAVLTELGLSNQAIASTYSSDPASDSSLASGNVAADFEVGVRIFDSLGVGHDIRIGFLRTGEASWNAEIYVLNDTELVGDSRQIASGEIVFNGDGTLASIDDSLTSNVSADFDNGSIPTDITFDFGDEDTANGLSQVAGENVNFLNQNGAPTGLLSSVSIDDEGFITANFNNGETRVLYRIPLADFANPNGLSAQSGNVYQQSFESGEVNLNLVGAGGVGRISPSSLESSNSDLSEELTDMIVAQRAYQASSRVITTSDELLEELSRLVS